MKHANAQWHKWLLFCWPFRGGGPDTVRFCVVVWWQAAEHFLVSFGWLTTSSALINSVWHCGGLIDISTNFV